MTFECVPEGFSSVQKFRINVETADGRNVTVFALPLFQHKSKVNTETADEKLPALQLHDSRIGLETESLACNKRELTTVARWKKSQSWRELLD